LKYLVDANVLSEPAKPRANPAATSWLTQNIAALAVTPIVLGELQYGILKLPSGRKRTELLEWFAESVELLAVLPIDAATAGEWSKLLAELRRRGRTMPVTDSLIAASARQYGLIVATRNIADYKFAGVRLVNPFN
jgi:predicted nucleic acid-binding protein